MTAISAIFNAKVKGKKRVKLKDIYDAEKARKEIGKAMNYKSTKLHKERYNKAREALKNYKPTFMKGVTTNGELPS